MDLFPLQSGLQGVVRGVQNNPIQGLSQAGDALSFRNVLSTTVREGSLQGTNAFTKASALPGRAAQYESIFDEASRTYGVSKSLLLAVAKQASNFNPNSVSPAGAQGIMQLMPGTAKTLGVKNAFDPYENIMGGAKLLRDNIKSFGSVPLALAAYNAGPGAVKKYGGVPPYKETQDYVRKIMADLGDNAYQAKSHFNYKGDQGGSSSAYSESNLGLGGGNGIFGNNSLLSFLGSSGGNSLLLSGVMFGIWHGNFIQAVYTAMMGIILGYYMKKTRRLFYVVLAHAVNNLSGSLPPALDTNFNNNLITILSYICIIPMFCVLYYLYKQGKVRSDDVSKPEYGN